MENNIPIENKPVQTQVPPQPVIPPQKNPKPFLWIILAIVVILLIGSGGVYFGLKAKKSVPQNQTTQISKPQITPTPTPISTANWKIYTNSEGHYSVSYPENFTIHINQVHEFETNSYQPAGNTIELDSPTAKAIPFILIQHQALQGSATLDDFITQNSSCVTVKSNTGKMIIIDGVNAKEYDNTGCGFAGASYVYIVANNFGYIITFNGTVDANFLNTFLSTFKFTDQNQVNVCTAFVCQYPSDWKGEAQMKDGNSFIIYSPDFVPAQELAITGSTISISESYTKYKSTDQDFNSSNFPLSMIKTVNWRTVDGVKAAQYNSSFESWVKRNK